MTIPNINCKLYNIKKILYTPIYSEKALYLQKYNQYIFYVNTNLTKKVLKSFFELNFNIKIKSIKIIKVHKKFNKSLSIKKVIIRILNNKNSLFLLSSLKF